MSRRLDLYAVFNIFTFNVIRDKIFKRSAGKTQPTANLRHTVSGGSMINNVWMHAVSLKYIPIQLCLWWISHYWDNPFMQIKCQCFDSFLARIQSEMIQCPFFSWAALRPIVTHSQLAPTKMGWHSGAVSALWWLFYALSCSYMQDWNSH